MCGKDVLKSSLGERVWVLCKGERKAICVPPSSTSDHLAHMSCRVKGQALLITSMTSALACPQTGRVQW